jgi:hypothetical protein
MLKILFATDDLTGSYMIEIFTQIHPPVQIIWKAAMLTAIPPTQASSDYLIMKFTFCMKNKVHLLPPPSSGFLPQYVEDKMSSISLST